MIPAALPTGTGVGRTAVAASPTDPSPFFHARCPCESEYNSHGIYRGNDCSELGRHHSLTPNAGDSSAPLHPPDLAPLLCPACVADALTSRLERREDAIKERDRVRAWCAERLRRTREEERRIVGGGAEEEGNYGGTGERGEIPAAASAEGAAATLYRLRDDSDRLRSHLEGIRAAESGASVWLAKATARNDEAEALLWAERSRVEAARGSLDMLFGSLLYSSTGEGENGIAGGTGRGGLPDAIGRLGAEVRRRRFGLALQAFEMHRVDVGPDYRGVHRLSEGPKRSFLPHRARTPSGVGKIGGLPLPHAGPSLYGMLPGGVLVSSLRLVASLTSTLGRCLGIVLPHPILLRPPCALPSPSSSVHDRQSFVSRSGNGCNGDRDLGDITDTVALEPGWDADLTLENSGGGDDFLSLVDSGEEQLPLPLAPSSSMSSLKSLMGSGVLSRALAMATGQPSSHHHHPSVASSRKDSRGKRRTNKVKESGLLMDEASISLRLRHAGAAVLRESASSTGGRAEYVLVPPHWGNDGLHGPDRTSAASGRSPSPRQRSSAERGAVGVMSSATVMGGHMTAQEREERFAVGLQLLQNDVVALCIKAGVPVSTLWPAEAVLLNLHSLRMHMSEQPQTMVASVVI